MSNLYRWVDEKKKEAMAQKLQKRGMPNYSQLPLSEKYGVSFTGLGQNGQLDRGSVAGRETQGTPAVYHEGELRANLPEGQMYVNADETNMMMNPRTIQERSFKSGGWLSNLAGNAAKLVGIGTSNVQNASNAATSVAKNTITQPIINAGQTTQNILGKPDGTMVEPPQVVTPKLAAQTETVDNNIQPAPVVNKVQPQTTQPLAPNTISVPGLVTNNLQPSPVVNKVQPNESTQIVTPKLAAQAEPVENKVQTEPDVATGASDRSARITQLAEAGLTEQKPETTTGTGEDYKNVQNVRNRRNLLAAQAEPETTTGTPGTTGTTEDQARNAGINWFLDALNKENPALMLEGRRAADELSLRQQQERSAMEQGLLQQGVDPGRARLEGQMLRDKQESELNDLASKYGIAGMKARQDIAGTLASQGLAGQQFEEERTKYKDSADWKSYEAAIAAGDFNTAAAAYQRVTGNPIDMTQMKAYQTYLTTKRGQDVTMGEQAITTGEQAITMGGLQISSAQVKLEADKFGLSVDRFTAFVKAVNSGADLKTANAQAGTNIDQPTFETISRDYKYTGTMQGQAVTTGEITIKSLRNTLSNEVADSIQSRINSGRSLEQINAEFPDAKLTMEEFKSMYDATPLGQKTFERKLGFANTLLQAEDGKGTNTAASVKILEELFPGTGIDFSGVVTTAKAATFNQGMSQLSDYVASGMDWEEAIAAIEKNGTLEMLGLDKAATEKLYRSLKVNAIDEQLAAIDESTSLTPEEKADARIFATAVLTGKLDYKIQKEYTVTDKDGKITTMYMDSGVAANYATSNPGSSIVGTGKSKVMPITDILEGTDEVTPKAGQIKGQGGIIVSIPVGKTNGDIYLGEDNNIYVVENGNPTPYNITDLTYNDVNKFETGSPILKKIADSLEYVNTSDLWSSDKVKELRDREYFKIKGEDGKDLIAHYDGAKLITRLV